MQILTFQNRQEMRDWLNENFSIKESIWIRLNKKDKSGLKAAEALEEALCFGWIDSIIKREDDIFYLKKFSPRRSGGTWSEINKKLARKLISEGKMAAPGLSAVEKAKENGHWDRKPNVPEITDDLINELRKHLSVFNGGVEMFDALNPSSKKMYAAYYFNAKKQETRQRRLSQIMVSMEKGPYLF